MRSNNEHNELSEGAIYRELHLLSEIERTPGTSQRSLSRRIGAAVGMTNLLLGSLARKGYVRMTRAGWRSWVYSLTPAGLSRKAQLSVTYIHRVLDHYQEIRDVLVAELEPLGLTTDARVAVYGADQFSELVCLALGELGIEVQDVFGPSEVQGKNISGKPVMPIAAIDHAAYDWVIATPFSEGSTTQRELEEVDVPKEKLVPLYREAGTTIAEV